MSFSTHGSEFDHSGNPDRLATPQEREAVFDVMKFVARQALPASDYVLIINWDLDPEDRFRFVAERALWEDDFDQFYYTDAKLTYRGPRIKTGIGNTETQRQITWHSIVDLPDNGFQHIEPNAPADELHVYRDGEFVPGLEPAPSRFIPGYNLVEHELVITAEQARLMQPAVGLLLAKLDQYSTNH